MRLVLTFLILITSFMCSISGCDSQSDTVENPVHEPVVTKAAPVTESAATTSTVKEPAPEPGPEPESEPVEPSEEASSLSPTVEEILEKVEIQFRQAVSSVYEITSNGWDMLPPGDVFKAEILWSENKSHFLLSRGSNVIEEYEWLGHYKCQRTNESEWEFTESNTVPESQWLEEIWEYSFVNDSGITLAGTTTLENREFYVLKHYYKGCGEYFDNEEVSIWISVNTMLPEWIDYSDMDSVLYVSMRFLSWNEPLIIEIPEFVPATAKVEVPGVPVLLSPEKDTLFSTLEEDDLTVTFTWMPGEGDTPGGYRWEAQYTRPIRDVPFGEWRHISGDFHEDITGNVTDITMTWIGTQPGRWRVQAYNEAGESEWSEWSYFDYTLMTIGNMMSGLGKYSFTQYQLHPAFEAGDNISISGSFYNQGGSLALYLQLIDPDGNIERTWSTHSPYLSERIEPGNIDIEYAVMKSGTYSLRLTNPTTTSYLRFQIFLGPQRLDISTQKTGAARTGVVN